jgi:hypothetical protein
MMLFGYVIWDWEREFPNSLVHDERIAVANGIFNAKRQRSQSWACELMWQRKRIRASSFLLVHEEAGLETRAPRKAARTINY